MSLGGRGGGGNRTPATDRCALNPAQPPNRSAIGTEVEGVEAVAEAVATEADDSTGLAGAGYDGGPTNRFDADTDDLSAGRVLLPPAPSIASMRH
jgi:hypothetical protein